MVLDLSLDKEEVMSIVKVDGLTRDYGAGKGVFDLSFSIDRGEVLGFLGPNGAGKTTTIRNLMGFIRADAGVVNIMGMDAWKDGSKIMKDVGYLPGEISFPDNLTGWQFIKLNAELRGMGDLSRAERLIGDFGIDTSVKLKKMSKGMKQKVAIVCAFMHDPSVLILDEPTSGLDPLMQAEFVKLVNEEKSRGKCILMSSHIFEEVESNCDRIIMIKDGRLIAVVDPEDIKRNQRKVFKIEFINEGDFREFIGSGLSIREVRDGLFQVFVEIDDSEVNRMIGLLHGRDVKFISEVKRRLEDHFMGFYQDGGAGFE